MSIVPGEGSFSGQLARRNYVIELPHERLEKAELNGQAAAVVFDQAADLTRIKIDGVGVHAPLRLRAWTHAPRGG